MQTASGDESKRGLNTGLRDVETKKYKKWQCQDMEIVTAVMAS